MSTSASASMGPRFNTGSSGWTRVESERRSTRRAAGAHLRMLWSACVSTYRSVSEAARWVGRCVATSWRILLIFTFLTVATPIMLFTSPLTMSFLQLLLGCGLATATWVIVKYPTEKAQERMTSDRVQPEMHLVLGTLLPELAVNLERLLLWVDLAMRGHSFPVYVRYPVLNLVAYVTGPLWFALLMMAMVFLLLVVSVISFGFVIPWVVPVLGLLLGYALLVPIWVISVYTLSFLPMLLATFVGSSREAYVAYREYREHARARRMVRPPSLPQQVRSGAPPASSSASSRSWLNFPNAGLRRSAASSTSASGPASSAIDGGRSAPLLATGGGQRNPMQGRQPWLSKQELLKMYQQRGLLTPPPFVPPPAPSTAPVPPPAAPPPAAPRSNSSSPDTPGSSGSFVGMGVSGETAGPAAASSAGGGPKANVPKLSLGSLAD